MVTLEKTAAGLFKSLLVGKGRDALLRTLAKPTFTNLEGRAPLILNNGASVVHQRPFFGQPISKKLLSMKDLLFGRQPGEVLSQRMTQGGLFGKGGVMHGTVAMTEPLKGAWENGGLKEVLKNHKSALGGHLTNFGLMTALPTYAAYHHAQKGDSKGLASTLAETLGWGLGYPFGMVGGPLIANKVRDLATSHMQPSLPKINLEQENYLSPYAEGLNP